MEEFSITSIINSNHKRSKMSNEPQKYEYDTITSELAMARLPSN
jgi:hypothetical protein